MDIQQILKVLKNERECIRRQSWTNGTVMLDGVMGHCDRNCAKCDLCLQDTEILEVYDFLINGYELLQNEGAESYTLKCKEPLSEKQIELFRQEWNNESVTASFETVQFPDNIRAILLGEEQEEDTHDN